MRATVQCKGRKVPPPTVDWRHVTKNPGVYQLVGDYTQLFLTFTTLGKSVTLYACDGGSPIPANECWNTDKFVQITGERITIDIET